MLEAIIKGDSTSITAKLELKLDEYDNLVYRVTRESLYYTVPFASKRIFNTEIFPKAHSYKIYGITKQYKNLFIKLGCTLDEYDLTLSTTRRILINKTSLALLMLLYNQQFREFCNVTESRTEILRHLKLELSKYIQL